MELINRLRKYLIAKRPTVSILSSRLCDFIIIKNALSTNKKLCIKTFTYRFEEADIIIIRGYYSMFELSELNKIISSLKTNCRVIFYGYTNLKLDRSDLTITKCNESIDTLVKAVLKVLN